MSSEVFSGIAKTSAWIFLPAISGRALHVSYEALMPTIADGEAQMSGRPQCKPLLSCNSDLGIIVALVIPFIVIACTWGLPALVKGITTTAYEPIGEYALATFFGHEQHTAEKLKPISALWIHTHMALHEALLSRQNCIRQTSVDPTDKGKGRQKGGR
eukprot:5112254-Amphidinium_carterae.1